MKEVITLIDIKLYHHSIDDNKNIDKMIEKSIQGFQIIDFKLNSAGGAVARKPFLEITSDLWDRTYALNVAGTFNTAQTVIPHMIENKAGVIFNIASVAAKASGAGILFIMHRQKGL